MLYTFKVHKEKNGYWAECVELEGCVTQADSYEELLSNMETALNLYLDEPESSILSFPLPKNNVAGKNIVKVPVNHRIAFAIKMKRYRARKGLSQRQAAELLGMKNVYSYQRLESTRKANPSLSTIARIKSIFPDFNIDDIFKHKKHGANNPSGGALKGG
ncbi:MAG: helix-turn-helix domain-containing protein [Spirochaetota bacterium]